MADWQPPETAAWRPPEIKKPAAAPQSTGAAGLLGRMRDALTGTHGIFGPDYLKGSAEGLKQMGRTVGAAMNPIPSRAGAEAGGAIVGSVLEGAGAFAGGKMAPEAATARTSAGGGSAAQRLLQDFRTAQVTPRVPTVGGGRVAGLAAQAGRLVPGSAVSRGLKRDLGETAASAERSAGQYGTAETSEAAGSVAQNAVHRFAADKSQAAADYSAFDRVMHGAPAAPVNRTVKLLQELRGRFPSAPGIGEIFTNPKLARLSDELGKAGGNLTMPEMRDLRSRIGYMLESKTFGPEEIPKADLRRVYGALTQDMQTAARARGPAAVKALNTATLNYGTRMRLIENLEPIAKAGSPEKAAALINRAATGGDAGLLQQAKKAMTPEEWGDIGAATIRGLGKPTAGAASAGPFSASSFSTSYAKISDHAKDLLFGLDVPGSPRAGLEALSRVVGQQKNVEKLANVSHSGEIALIGAAATRVIEEVVSGRIPWGVAAGWAGAYGAGKFLMSPILANWLYRLPDVVKGSPDLATAYPRALAALQTTEAGARMPAPAMAQPAPSTKPPTSARDYLDRRARGEGEGGPVQLPSGITVQPRAASTAPAQ